MHVCSAELANLTPWHLAQLLHVRDSVYQCRGKCSRLAVFCCFCMFFCLSFLCLVQLLISLHKQICLSLSLWGRQAWDETYMKGRHVQGSRFVVFHVVLLWMEHPSVKTDMRRLNLWSSKMTRSTQRNAEAHLILYAPHSFSVHSSQYQHLRRTSGPHCPYPCLEWEIQLAWWQTHEITLWPERTKDQWFNRRNGQCLWQVFATASIGKWSGPTTLSWSF